MFRTLYNQYQRVIFSTMMFSLYKAQKSFKVEDYRVRGKGTSLWVYESLTLDLNS